MPSSHSSSSHSSSSHSSSSHSSGSHSSGGFSSHSSGGFSSHSSSSHSSSWGSSDRSRDYGGSTRGVFGGLFTDQETARRRPSSHSGSSRSSARAQTVYRSHFVSSGSMRGTVIDRPRYNQPRGYVASEHFNIDPIPHYCVRHNYFYYPASWTDEATGQEYKKGYYDENGQYYKDVVFRSDGKYKNLICQCEYCDTITKIDWTEGGPLICPQCGGTMKILSALDEYTQDPLYEKSRREPGYVDYADRASVESDSEETVGDGDKSIAVLFVVIAIIFASIIGLAALASQRNSSYTGYDEAQYDENHRPEDGWVYLGNGAWGKYSKWYPSGSQLVPEGQDPQTPLSNPELFGEIIYLNRISDDTYVITGDSDHDKELVWGSDEENYYDADSGLWAWYNTDVVPPLWQYWYEPISGIYGDYGWMEYEDGTWYVEVERGQWLPVPDTYDLSPLWHIDWDGSSDFWYDDDTPSDLIPYGSELLLTELAPGVYGISDGEADKTLFWDEAGQSWHDEDSDLWLWYNTDVDPDLWQYWYEPISGDYGDYGWMEYEDGIWYIEADAGDWIEVPAQYDVSPLWHIE